MAISGRKPKPVGTTVHRNQLVHEWTEVEDTPYLAAERLPVNRTNGRSWPPRTKATWKAWSTMPHCSLWAPSDWAFALDTLELVALMHDGESKYATEVRNREKVLGTTVDFRRDLRIRYVAPKLVEESDAAAVGVTKLSDYRDL